MTLLKAVRAWFISVLACTCLLAGWVVLMHSVTGRWDHVWHNAVDVALGFGSVFAVTAAAFYVPAFAILTVLFRERFTRAGAVMAGAALAPVALLAIGLGFRESEGPQTILGFIGYWGTHLPEAVIGMLPFAAAGAVFGLAWVSSGRAPHARRRIERPV